MFFLCFSNLDICQLFLFILNINPTCFHVSLFLKCYILSCYSMLYTRGLLCRISEVSMDCAVSGNTGQDLATAVEGCDCPIGYKAGPANLSRVRKNP
jgi:hypothetical protein